VVYDASVLYPSTLRDLLLRIAQAGMVQAKWTEAILDEVFTALRPAWVGAVLGTSMVGACPFGSHGWCRRSLH